MSDNDLFLTNPTANEFYSVIIVKRGSHPAGFPAIASRGYQKFQNGSFCIVAHRFVECNVGLFAPTSLESCILIFTHLFRQAFCNSGHDKGRGFFLRRFSG
jgi:hypothetical protein